MISGEVLKYRNGFLIEGRYETPLTRSSRFPLTLPAERLTRDEDELLAFYDFPAEHWTHIRTPNPIESTFATVRHRTKRSKGCLSMKTMELMVFMVIKEAEKTWLRLRGKNQLPKLITGVKFSDGIEQLNQHDQNAA
jgi:transposase-like protein